MRIAERVRSSGAFNRQPGNDQAFLCPDTTIGTFRQGMTRADKWTWQSDSETSKCGVGTRYKHDTTH